MKVYGNIRTIVDVDPIEVLKGLLKMELGDSVGVTERDGKYFELTEISIIGNHSKDVYTEISKDKFDYINSLSVVLQYLENKI